MKLSRAISIASQWAEGHLVNLRYGEGEAYHKLCIKALKLMREQSKVVESDQFKWISVKDALPEDWKEKGGDLINYLVFMPEYGVDVGNYAKPVKTWLCMGIPCKVTHWMPLPEPPEEEV